MAYFLQANKSDFFLSRRVNGFHHFVFHGTGEFPGREFGSGRWHGPGATNDIREIMHIQRSGHVIPDVFSPRGGSLVVSPRVRKALTGLPGIQFHPVVFEHVADLPMPPLGQWPPKRLRELARSPYSAPVRSSKAKDDVFFQELMRHPDVPELRSRFDGYTQLLPAIGIELDDVHDWQKVDVYWGSYRTYYLNDPHINDFSRSVLDRYAICNVGGCVTVLSEAAFTAMAPFLDLEFYDIAALDLRPEL